MKKSASVADAVYEAGNDMRALKGRLISRVTVHAIDAKGGHKIVAVNGAGDNVYWLREGTGGPQRRPAEPVVITSDAARGRQRYGSGGGGRRDRRPPVSPKNAAAAPDSD